MAVNGTHTELVYVNDVALKWDNTTSHGYEKKIKSSSPNKETYWGVIGTNGVVKPGLGTM